MTKLYYQSRFAAYSLWIDLLLLNVTFGFTFYSYSYFRSGGAFEFSDSYLILLLVRNLLWVALTYFLQTYQVSRLELSVDVLFGRFLRAIMLQMMIILALLFVTKHGSSVSRLLYGCSVLSFVVTGAVARLVVLQWLRSYRMAGNNVSGFLTIGKSELCDIIRQRYEERLDLGLRYDGTFEFGAQPLDQEMHRLDSLVETTRPELIYCDMTSLTPEQIRSIVSLGERYRAQIRLVPDFRGFLPNEATMQYHDVVPVIEVNTRPYSNVRDETYKRMFDLVFSSVVMVVGLPVFGLVALLVKVLSPGPVFFRQPRTGRWGETFYIFKFRTMYTDADRLGLQHSQGALDPRVTPIGRFLRRSRLDELPQFINVLRGEMSVVGPRPLFRYDVDMLMEAAPEHFKKLLTVKPGITSIGQLRVGYADTLSLNLTRLRIDLQYLRKYSVWYDMYLIMLTMYVMVSGRGK